MSVRRRQNFLGGQRIDVPYLKSVESAVSNDFDELISGLVIGENKSYVVRGFEINMPGAIGSSANGLQLIVSDTSILHGASDESGTFYNIPSGTPAEILSSTTNDRVDGAFTPSTDNYVGVELVREVDDSTIDQSYFWNPTTNIEVTKTVPLAIILDYKIVISTSSFASNVLPIAIVQTDASNNVISITDRRPMLLRLGTAGNFDPNPFYIYPWADGRSENFYTSTSSATSPFQGGDKQIKNLKEFFDALMTEVKLLKGTPYWYSENPGSISNLRADLANTAFTGKGNVVHGRIDFQGQVAGMTADVLIRTVNTGEINNITLTANDSNINTLVADYNAANPENQIELVSSGGSQIPMADIVLTSKPGQVNWSQDIYLRFIGGRLNYKILSNDTSTEVSLADNQVAYINLVRDKNIIPPLIFTNGGTVVTSVGNASWTNDVEPGDFIKDASKGSEFYYEIDTVDSLSQVTLTVPYEEASSGPAGFDAQYAWGTYETNPSPLTSRHVFIADREDVPFDEDVFWLFFRSDDGGGIPRVYARILGGTELEQGEARTIADNTAQAVLDYIGSNSESDTTPTYNESATDSKNNQTHYNSVAEENLTDRISRLTTMMADKAQDKTVKLVSDHTVVTNTTNTTFQDITFSGGSGVANVIVPSSADNGTIGLSGTLSLEENQVAFYQIDRNAAFTIADLSVLTVADIDSVPLNEKTFIFAYRLTGDTVYLWDNSSLGEGDLLDISVLREYVQQNNTLKMVKGGTWSWDLATNTLSNSLSAYVQIAGLSDSANEIIAQNIVLDADQKVAYVEINRGITPSVLTVNVADISTVDLSSDDVFVIARRTGGDVLVGTNSFALKDREFLELDGALAEINRHHGQLLVRPETTLSKRVEISGADIAKLSGSQISLEQKSLLLDFNGAVIDFSTGKVFQSDGGTPLNDGTNDFTPATIGANEYFFYSVTLLPNTVNENNTITGQILVLPSSASNAVLADAPRAPFPSSGIKLGNVYVQEDGGGSILNIDYENIISLGVGGSGSGGTGDANELLERLKNRLANYGAYEYMTPVIFSTVEEDLTFEANTTANFSVVNSNYEFETIGTVFESVQLLDAEFLAEEIELDEIELIHYWNLDSLDSAAIYEVSRDGGNEWQSVSMSRIGSSDTYRGTHTFAEEAANSFSQTEGTFNGTYTNLTDLNELSRDFILANTTTVKKVTAGVNKTAAATGYVFAVAVKDDGGGLPSTDPLDEIGRSKFVSIDGLVAGAQSVDFEIRFTAPAETYHIVFKTDVIYKTEYTNSAGANKIAIEDDGADVAYTLEGLELDLRVRITSGTDEVASEGFGLFYKDDNKVSPVDGNVFRNVSTFVGDVDNLDTFTLTFLPDPRLLHVYEWGTGQVYRYGAFVIQGYDVIFEPNTFNKPETVSLEFLQIQGGSFDNSDKNASLLAANHLGSTDANIDLSVAGRGLFLRRPDGTLREITIDDGDNIVIYSV